MTVSKNFVVTPATSTTGTLKRNVSDWIRRLNPVITPVMSLVKTQGISEMGDLSESKGLIDKESTDTMKFEWFTSTPIAMYYDATGGDATSIDMADTSAFLARDIVVNLNTLEVGIVIAIASATELTITAVGGTWSCAAGDKIALSCNAQEEASSTATSRTKEPDNNFNYVFPFRFPVSIADTAKNSPHYGESLMKRYATDNMYFTLRNMENALILGKKAASETTAVTIGGASLTVYTSRGLLDYSQVTFDCGGAMTYDRFNNELFQDLPNTLAPDDELVMLCGKKIYGQMNNWVTQKLMYIESDVDVFGGKTEKFRCGAYTIKPQMHDLFNQGPLQDQFVIFRTKDLKYRFKKGMDLQVKENIQSPSTMGTTNELRGVFGLQVNSGGAEIVRGINWN
jgi:hypothetical protein